MQVLYKPHRRNKKALTKQREFIESSSSYLGFKLGTLRMIHVAITVEQVTLQSLPWFLKKRIEMNALKNYNNANSYAFNKWFLNKWNYFARQRETSNDTVLTVRAPIKAIDEKKPEKKFRALMGYWCDAIPTKLWSHTLGVRSFLWVPQCVAS